MTDTTPASTGTMTVWMNDEYGPARDVARRTVPVPEPRSGEVLLRVRATALNAGDVRLLLGDPLLVRPVFGLRRPKHPIRGMDAVGTVVATGPNVIGAEVGDEMIGELAGGGGLGEYVSVRADRLQPVPPDVDPRLAVTLPVAAGTAWQALDAAGVGIGARTPRVLVLGASGGVGTFAVQLAALRGAEVWASCAERNSALVERLGAMQTFDHRTRPLSTLPERRFDAVIDVAGGIPLRELRRLVDPHGVIALVTGDGGHVLGPIPRMLRAALLSMTRGARIRPVAATPRREVLTALLDLLAEGRLTPVVAQEYAFADAGVALVRLEEGHVAGKLVVRVG